MKIGIIDIGSNTCKLLIAEGESASSPIDFVILEQSSLPCRLLSLQADGQNFIEEKQSRLLLQCIGEFMKICKKHAVLKVQAVATEAFRKSSNRQQISLLIEKEFGFEIKILTGQEEARGIAKGLDTDPNIKSFQSYSALDIGGGSVEFIHVKNQKLIEVLSLPIGAVRMARMDPSFSKEIIPAENQKKLRNYVREIISDQLCHFLEDGNQLVGTGGTIVFCRNILQRLNNQTDHACIHRRELEFLTQTVCGLKISDRVDRFPQLPADRADIFPYGLLTVLEIMSLFDTQTLTHSFHNLRYGLAREMFDSLESYTAS